jgi:hypothetical protein
MRKRNYLNNKDILKEIHKSKNTYCSFVDDETDNQFDIILNSLDDINTKSIAEAKQNRAKRIALNNYEEDYKNGGRNKLADFEIDPKLIKKTDLVFRIMTFDHIPDEPGRKKNPKTIADTKTKLNFPPFQHYRIDEKNDPFCVGKSHWEGGLSNGSFCKEHGKATDQLARMWMKLCEKYALRSNVRGYTYNDEMKNQAILQLAQIGLQFDESKSNNPFAYYTAAVTNSFVRVINTEKRNQSIRDDLLEMNNMAPSYTRQHQGEWESAQKRWQEDQDKN